MGELSVMLSSVPIFALRLKFQINSYSTAKSVGIIIKREMTLIYFNSYTRLAVHSLVVPLYCIILHSRETVHVLTILCFPFLFSTRSSTENKCSLIFQNKITYLQSSSPEGCYFSTHTYRVLHLQLHEVRNQLVYPALLTQRVGDHP